MIDDRVVYWDNAATTKVDQRVLDSMIPYFTEFYGNASSSHKFGKISEDAVEEARNQISRLINSEPNEIIFTSGATESINLGIKGFVEANIHKGNHIITVKTEHKAVLATCEYLEQRGIEVTYLNVDHNGLISLEEIKSSIKPNTILISVMYVNNEIGVIQPIKKIGQIAQENSIAFFCDATQAIGKIKVDVEYDNIDMLAFSGHKINAPKGIGALYKRKQIEISPILHGGSQELGLRAGTLNTPLIVGLGVACLISLSKDLELEILNERKKIVLFEKQVLKLLKGSFSISLSEYRIPYIISLVIPGLDASNFVGQLKSFFISNGSACNSNIILDSHVLSEIIDPDEVKSTIRLSFVKVPDISESYFQEFRLLLIQNAMNYA